MCTLYQDQYKTTQRSIATETDSIFDGRDGRTDIAIAKTGKERGQATQPRSLLHTERNFTEGFLSTACPLKSITSAQCLHKSQSITIETMSPITIKMQPPQGQEHTLYQITEIILI